MENKIQELSATEALKQFEKYLAQNNMGGIAYMMGQEEEYLREGPHWSGKCDIGLYHDSLKQSAMREQAEKKIF